MASKLPSTMRACIFSSAAGGLERNLQISDAVNLPAKARSLGKGQTLVKVSYASVNPVDCMVPELPIVGRFAVNKPAIPGADYAGTVVATSRSDLTVGQRVFGMIAPPAFGTLAEYAVAERNGLAPLPNGVTLEAASSAGVCGQTAYQCIAPHVKPGDKIFINGGSGGVGSFGIQIAKALGCHVVTACSGSNAEFCKNLGADETIDYRTQDVGAALKRGGTQFDHVVDFAGVPALYWQSQHFLKPDGKFINIAGKATWDSVTALLKIFMWPSFLGGGKRKFAFHSAQTSEHDLGVLSQWMSEGKVKPAISHTYELSQVSEAYTRLKAGGFAGKLVVKVADAQSA